MSVALAQNSLVERRRRRLRLDEQYTPTKFFAPYHERYAFTLDPCATARSAKCPRFYTKAEDGLRRSWAGERVWLNPPYSAIPDWLEKAHVELADRTPLVVALLPAWTDRRWWHRFIEPVRGTSAGPELEFVKGRIIFGTPRDPQAIRRKSGGKFPSVVVVWDRRVPRSAGASGRASSADSRQLAFWPAAVAPMSELADALTPLVPFARAI